MPQRVGIVLAGGRGERIGVPKGRIFLGETTLAERAAATLWPLCGSVLISLAEGEGNPAPSYAPLFDPPPADRGPLVGIDAAFHATGDADLLVLACDYPHVRRDLLHGLLSHVDSDYDLVMMTDFTGRDHPLVALWARTAAPVVRRALERRRHKVRALLEELKVRRLGPGEFPSVDLDHELTNLNRPEDLRSLERDMRADPR